MSCYGGRISKIKTVSVSNLSSASGCYYLMNKLILLKPFSLLLLMLFNVACVASECVYDENIFSENKYKNNKSIVSYLWSSDKNEVKGVLNNGNLFTVKHWSCDHYGTHAVLIVGPYLENIPDELNSDILALANLALKTDEVSLLKNYLSKESILLSADKNKYSIKTDEFSEFYIAKNIVNELIILEIKLYKN